MYIYSQRPYKGLHPFAALVKSAETAWPQAASDVHIGGGHAAAAASAKNTDQISKLGGSDGMPPGKFLF